MAETLKSQIEDYLDYCDKVRNMSSVTLGMKKNVLDRFLKIMQKSSINTLGRLDNVAYNRWVANEASRGVSARSLNAYNAIVLAMVRYYREIGFKIPLKISLIGKLKEGEIRRRFYSQEEVGQAIAVAKRQGSPATALIIQIMFETGMRIAEVTRLRLANFSGRQINFIGKGRKPREVYIRQETLENVLEYVKNRRISDYLWVEMRADASKFHNSLLPPTTMTVRKRLRTAFSAAGFQDFYPHALRHSFATDLQRRGASVEEIKEMIGHESITTTERYLHGFEGRLEELFDKYR